MKTYTSFVLGLASVGTLSYIVADLSHEALGHGIMCLLLGNKVSLISSVYFRSVPHSFITDTGGPLGNLIIGAGSAWYLKNTSAKHFWRSLLLYFFASFNLYWFSWMLLYGGLSGVGDFILAFAKNIQLIWRTLLIFFGITFYIISFKKLATLFRMSIIPLAANFSTPLLRQTFFIPWLAAGVASLVAAGFYKSVNAGTFYEAINFPMFLPVLLIPRYLNLRTKISESELTTSIELPLIALATFIAFCAVMGRGITF
ncbi:hypothetical protein [Mucilaginibacter ginkgonis]|uniref:Peptidase M50B-like protein n=1 Tax=Mucilaginibacter ginkgonis TaxID=2682091 RepID=A0A6I4I5R8_9SPHI|nr:hypothetical protein [Mucilaginibacter ginkgonis]QQL49064.1 hypothetical protein GO620_012875 [Mucilaginibacter ginkgonis]